jgi:hypothetical protein
MPNGPQGQKRPADAVGCAVLVARIATGDEDDVVGPVGRERIGTAGATARARTLSPARRQEIAKVAAAARWS